MLDRIKKWWYAGQDAAKLEAQNKKLAEEKALEAKLEQLRVEVHQVHKALEALGFKVADRTSQTVDGEQAFMVATLGMQAFTITVNVKGGYSIKSI